MESDAGAAVTAAQDRPRLRVLLINPPSPERLGTPLLGFQYVAAALLRHGCEVRVIDAAARYFAHDADWIVNEARAFEPHVTGVALFSRWAWHAYQLVAHLRGLPGLLVAGGAHTTVRPQETLAHGFDAALTGEAELSMVALVQALEQEQPLATVPGIWLRAGDGTVTQGPCSTYIADLDALAEPFTTQHLFDRAWYGASGREQVPGGIITSRGCPARCTFCANYVTGRSFRHRSADCVVHELNTYHAITGAQFFPFWDDALTARVPRLMSLCETIERDIRFPLSFSAITRANLVNPDLLRRMKRAGLIHVNFGVESGDDDILRVIKKGIRTDHVVRALEWARAEGLSTACNFMMGFPEDTPETLEHTLRFMERIAPLVDTFSTMGVVVPFPGTPIYDLHHQSYGFTEWWLNESYSRYHAFPPIEDRHRFNRFYIDDTNLELDFFRYDEPTRAMIRECLTYKGEHNLRHMGLLRDPVFAPEPPLAVAS